MRQFITRNLKSNPQGNTVFPLKCIFLASEIEMLSEKYLVNKYIKNNK